VTPAAVAEESGGQPIGGDAGVGKEAALDVGRNAPGRLPGSVPLLAEMYHLRHQTGMCSDASTSLTKRLCIEIGDLVRSRVISMPGRFPPPALRRFAVDTLLWRP